MKLLLCGFKYNEIYVLTIAAAAATSIAGPSTQIRTFVTFPTWSSRSSE